MNAAMKIATLMVATVLVAGCSTWKHVKQGRDIEVHTERFAFSVPSGWTYQRMQRDQLTISRDGPGIQKMSTQWFEWNKPFYYGDVEKDRLQRGMLPTDVAQQILAARQRQRGIESLDLVSLEPAVVTGVEGYRAEYAYRTERGLNYRGVSYGAIRPEGVYVVTFEAPGLHFYERDVPTFEQIMASGRARTVQEVTGLR